MDARSESPAARLALVVAGVLLLQGAILTAMGQPLICECGTVRLWNGTVLGPENSQQLSDWYTPSHIIHGILFYAAIKLAFPRLSVVPALALALTVEMAWEVLENSPAVIQHYRSQALAQGYSGDSVVNSLSDTVAAAAGFLFARAVPVWVSVAVVVGFEVLTAIVIRDGLILNVIQFIYPVPFIYEWQSGASPSSGRGG